MTNRAAKFITILLSILPIIFGLLVYSIYSGESLGRLLGFDSAGLQTLSISLAYIFVIPIFVFSAYTVITAITYASLDKLNRLLGGGQRKRIVGTDFIPQSFLGLVVLYILLLSLISWLR